MYIRLVTILTRTTLLLIYPVFIHTGTFALSTWRSNVIIFIPGVTQYFRIYKAANKNLFLNLMHVLAQKAHHFIRKNCRTSLVLMVKVL